MNVTDLLDQLDALRNDATGAFPWRQNGPELSGIDDAEDLSVGCTWVARDAALIVAAVNTLPQLTAVVRAVHALADEWDAAEDPSAQTLYAVLAALTTDTTTEKASTQT